MKTLKSILLFSFLIVSISSCGYQLRGSVSIEDLESIQVFANNRNNVTRLLEQKLSPYRQDNSVNKTEYPAIRVLSVDTTRRQLSVNSSGRVDEYEISKTVKYQFIFSKTEIINGSLNANASYDFHENQMQGTREKEDIALDTIDRNLVRKLLFRFKASFKANST